MPEKLSDLFTAVIDAKFEDQPDEPEDYRMFLRLSIGERNAQSAKFYNQQHIMDYTDAKWKVELHNRDNFIWMWDVYETERDPAKRLALEKKMDEFVKKIVKQKNPYESLMLDFKQYKFNNPDAVKVEDVGWEE